MQYKSSQPKKLFDEEFLLEKPAAQKDPLVKLKERIDFERFRPLLEEIFHNKEKGIGPLKDGLSLRRMTESVPLKDGIRHLVRITSFGAEPARMIM